MDRCHWVPRYGRIDVILLSFHIPSTLFFSFHLFPFQSNDFKKTTTNKSISLFPISSSPNRDEENPLSAALSFPSPPFLPPHRLIKSLWSRSPGGLGVGKKFLLSSAVGVSIRFPHMFHLGRNFRWARARVDGRNKGGT